MKAREEWLKEVAQRQDNIDPIRRIPNGALFQGTLINGSQRLNPVQRIGAIGIGLFTLTPGCVFLAKLVAALRSRDFAELSLYTAILTPFSLWFGWRITINALLNDPQKRRMKKS